MFFEIYEELNLNSQWRWRLKARNGKIIADSGEAYSSEQSIRRAIWRLNKGFLLAGCPLEIRIVD